MPINHKRRIFRPEGLRLGLPSRGVVLTLLAGALIVSGGAWIGLQPSEARPPPRRWATCPPAHRRSG